MPKHFERHYATVRWSVDDIKDRFNVTDDEAHEFLEVFEDKIADAMIEEGWLAIEALSSFKKKA